MQSQTSAYVLTSLITAPPTGDLALLSNVKDELDITDASMDARLKRLISEESAAIAGYCGRVFGKAIWFDQFRPQKGIWGEGIRAASNPLLLNKYPLAAKPVAFTGTTGVNNPTVTGIASTAGLRECQPVFGPGITPGTTISAVLANGIMLSAPATAAGVAVQLSVNVGIAELIGGTVTWLAAGTEYETEVSSNLPGDESAARLFRLNRIGQPRTWPEGIIQVWYQAGYSLPDNAAKNPSSSYTLPADLETACIRILVGRVKKRGRDPMLVSRQQPNLGIERWWVGSTPGQKGPYPDDIQFTLDRYRVPVMAST